MAHEAISQLSFKGLVGDSDNFWHDDSVDVPLPHEVGGPFEVVDSALFPLLLAQVVEDELEIFGGGAKDDLVGATLGLVVVDFDKVVVNEDVAVDDVEHTIELEVGIGGEDQPDGVEVVYAAVLLYYEAPLNQLTDLLPQLRRTVLLGRKEVETILPLLLLPFFLVSYRRFTSHARPPD